MKQHIWTSIAIVLATFSIVVGFQTFSGALLAGKAMLLSAIACRSANRRRLFEVKSSLQRVAFEFLLIIAMVLLVILQNGFRGRVAIDPIPNLVIPLICLLFYSLAFCRARSAERVPEVNQ